MDDEEKFLKYARSHIPPQYNHLHVGRKSLERFRQSRPDMPIGPNEYQKHDAYMAYLEYLKTHYSTFAKKKRRYPYKVGRMRLEIVKHTTEFKVATEADLAEPSSRGETVKDGWLTLSRLDYSTFHLAKPLRINTYFTEESLLTEFLNLELDDKTESVGCWEEFNNMVKFIESYNTSFIPYDFKSKKQRVGYFCVLKNEWRMFSWIFGLAQKYKRFPNEKRLRSWLANKEDKRGFMASRFLYADPQEFFKKRLSEINISEIDRLRERARLPRGRAVPIESVVDHGVKLLYYHLWKDVLKERGTTYLKCDNCHHWFLKGNRRKYCCDACANSFKQRRYRNKHRLSSS